MSSRWAITNFFIASLNSGHSVSLKFIFFFKAAFRLSLAFVVKILGGEPSPAATLTSLSMVWRKVLA